MIRSIALTLALLITGCSSSTGSSPNGSGNGNGNGGGGAAGSGGGGAVGGNGSDGGTTTPPIPAGGLVGNAKIGTYIVLGDSISDNGGTGPFFYDLLNADLAKKYPGLMYVHAAQAGAITDTYSDNLPPFGAPLLKTQVSGLANNYPGDVLVTITIGGNDLNYHANKAIAMTDAQIRTEFSQHLDAELGELAMPGRLGSGKVYVVLANIYDFTDGMGDFGKVMCGPGANVAPTSDQMTFGEWNGISAGAIAKIASGTLFDMHAAFMGHGYNNTDASQVWYDRSSCIHPNAAGHDAIRRGMYQVITGETL